MAFTETQMQTAVRWVNDHRFAPCRICTGTNIELVSGFAMAPNWDSATTNIQAGGVPCLTLVCRECGNTTFINAVVAKVL